MLGQHARSDFRVLLDELVDRVAGDFRFGGGEVHEGFEAGVGFAEDAVAVTRDDLAGFESVPDVIFDFLVGEVVADLGLHL